MGIRALCVTMADDREISDIVSLFFLNTCQLRQQFDQLSYALLHHSRLATTPSLDDEANLIPLITGSVAEFCVWPMLTCVGDVDIMYHSNRLLAIPAGTAPPTQLPAEFHSRVTVHEIVDSEFPGYVYLVSSYLLTECTDDGKYRALQCPRVYALYDTAPRLPAFSGKNAHGPAIVERDQSGATNHLLGGIDGSVSSADEVPCVRCLSWPTQAADWPSRHREYGWPDSATVERVVSNGCDVVNVAHRLCKQDEWMNKHQHRLSFSRAEIVLLNSWMPIQQIVYHNVTSICEDQATDGQCQQR